LRLSITAAILSLKDGVGVGTGVLVGNGVLVAVLVLVGVFVGSGVSVGNGVGVGCGVRRNCKVWNFDSAKDVVFEKHDILVGKFQKDQWGMKCFPNQLRVLRSKTKVQ
jgi:hypothetical protein